MHPSVDVELRLWSRVTAVLVEPTAGHGASKSSEKRKKAKISMGCVENFGSVMPNFSWGQNVELEKGSRITPPVDLNEKPQYPRKSRSVKNHGRTLKAIELGNVLNGHFAGRRNLQVRCRGRDIGHIKR
jgi:hypothetical protein